MIRACDGTDPNLIDQAGDPCDCGLIFDDVGRSMVFPHAQIPLRSGRVRRLARPKSSEDDALYEKVHASIGVPYVWNSGPPAEHGAIIPLASEGQEIES